jgi:hypothetical protein
MAPERGGEERTVKNAVVRRQTVHFDQINLVRSRVGLGTFLLAGGKI